MIGFSPASNAAAKYRSTRRVLGSGLAAAITIKSWVAFATITRSTWSLSSALLRSRVFLGSMRTILAKPPSSPVVSPVSATTSPTTGPSLRNSLARVAFSWI